MIAVGVGILIGGVLTSDVFSRFTIAHVLVSVFIILGFVYWQRRSAAIAREYSRHGTADFGSQALRKFRRMSEGAIYIGKGYYYPKQGHILTVAGTRSGKGVNLLTPNLLGAGSFEGSWVVIDPKGELAAITAAYQRAQGKQVRILNPWNLLDLPGSTYNPLDIISNANSLHLADDAQLLANMIVPSEAGKDDHWKDRARSIIAALLMYLATDEDEALTLNRLWELLRLPFEQWLETLAKMAMSSHPVSGNIIRGSASEALALWENSEKEATSILSTAQRWTDIFKSLPLQRSLNSSSFGLNELTDGNTVLYVIIPADKLKSHSVWLRLVVTTALKSVVRNPNKRVMFCLDEFYALGYLPEIEIALGTYAGYGVTIWAVLQSLVQLQDLYGKNWENFIGNSAVIQAFGLNDNTTTRYFSQLVGKTSIPTIPKGKLVPTGSSPRQLMTPDEARRCKDILLFIENHGVVLVPKLPYFLHKEWSQRARPNPYYTS